MYSKFDAVNLYVIHFIENRYSNQSNRNSYNYLNDDSTKYFSLIPGSSTYNIIVLHPGNGSHITTKIVTPPATSFDSTFANGRFSNNLMLIYVPQTSPSGDNVILVNTEDWSVTTYVSSSLRLLFNYSPIFDTDQIMLLLRDSILRDITVQTAYDKLDKTEFYSL